jgi:uncharacterized 2Fe-2S/4Fe-4S cluster protein (DUF4445 family)
MALPNKVDTFPKLRAVVKMPEPKLADAGLAGMDNAPRRRSREERAARRRG